MLRKNVGKTGAQHHSLTIKFASNCSKCAIRMPARSKAFYDHESKRVVCTSCVRLLKQGKEPVKPLSPAQMTVDRLDQILATGGPSPAQQSEFEQLVNSLKVQYAAERLAQSFLADLYEVHQSESYICMSIRRADHCNGCANYLSGGTVAVWDKDAHRIWCLDCASDFVLD